MQTHFKLARARPKRSGHFDSRIAGIPCQIEVISWRDSTFDVLDRKGYRARWLENKLTQDDCVRIAHEMYDFYQRHKND